MMAVGHCILDQLLVRRTRFAGDDALGRGGQKCEAIIAIVRSDIDGRSATGTRSAHDICELALVETKITLQLRSQINGHALAARDATAQASKPWPSW